MLQAVVSCFRNSFNFTGRASRSENNYFALFIFIVSITFDITSEIVPPMMTLGNIFRLLAALPSVSLIIRRLHDTNMSGWNYLWIFIVPFLVFFTKNTFFLVGWLPYIYWLCFKAGDNRTNQYGPNPLQGSNVGINYGEPKANPMFEAIWRAEIEMPLMSSPLNGNDFLGKWTENEEKILEDGLFKLGIGAAVTALCQVYPWINKEIKIGFNQFLRDAFPKMRESDYLDHEKFYGEYSEAYYGNSSIFDCFLDFIETKDSLFAEKIKERVNKKELQPIFDDFIKHQFYDNKVTVYTETQKEHGDKFERYILENSLSSVSN